MTNIDIQHVYETPIYKELVIANIQTIL